MDTRTPPFIVKDCSYFLRPFMLLVSSPLFCFLLKNNKKPVETDVVIMLFEAHWSCYNSWHVPHRCKPEKCWLEAFLRHQSREAQITVCTASDCRRCLKNKIILLCLTLLFRQYFWTHSIVTFVPAPRKCLLFWWRISLSLACSTAVSVT